MQIAAFILASLLVLVLILLVTYRVWAAAKLRALAADSEIVQTVRGPIEYVSRGEGPVVVVLHGSPGGCDLWMAMRHLVDHGFRLVCPSRPGYLRTPLSVGRTPEEQADAVIALLDALDIERAAILGLSGGGPIALQIAIRHPSRVWALSMMCAISKTYDPIGDLRGTFTGTLFFIKGVQDVIYWLMSVLARYFPHYTLEKVIELVSNYDDPGQARVLTRQITSDPAQLRTVHAMMDNGVPFGHRKEGFENDMLHYRALPRYPLERICAPTVVIHSRRDGDVNFSHAEFSAETIPGAELFGVDGCGHLVLLGHEGRDALERQTEFLRAHTPGRGGSRRPLPTEPPAR